MRPREDLGKGSTSEGIVSDHDLLGVAENHMLLQDLASHSPCSLFAPFVIRAFQQPSHECKTITSLIIRGG